LQSRKVNELKIRAYPGSPTIVTKAAKAKPATSSRAIAITLNSPVDSIATTNFDSVLVNQIGAIQVFSGSTSDSIKKFIRGTTAEFRRDSGSTKKSSKDSVVVRLAPRISSLVPRFQPMGDSLTMSMNTIWLTDESNNRVLIKL